MLPRKDIIVAERWLGKTVDGHVITLDEAAVRKTFGDCFTNELKQMKRAWVDIPVGDLKPSRLKEFPHLNVVGAPFIHYVQSEGKDLCVSKSLASAFAALGWEAEAKVIDGFGEHVMTGAGVETVKRVKECARQTFPKWLTIRKLPSQWNWKTDMREHEAVLGVLLASDDSCSHAVTIHDGYIYDANETVALPLCDEALDYCTSTATVESKFVAFKFGFRFYYNGTKMKKKARMMLYK